MRKRWGSLAGMTKQSGIALGPILFIIAILAVLAAAIAAGSGAFNANTNTESAKAMAESIITLCEDYQRAQQKMVMENGCDESKLDYTPNTGYPAGATWVSGDYTGGNGTNRSGNGQCAFYDVRGGGLLFKQVPKAAMATTVTGAYTVSDATGNVDAYAGYPYMMTTNCIAAQGTCPLGAWTGANAAIVMFITYLNYDTCKQINNILQQNWDPKSTFISVASSYFYSAFNNCPLRSAGNYVAGGGPNAHAGVSEACAYDYNSNSQNSAFVFMCPVMIR